MTEINGFDFSKYDKGGVDATANDGKLTGAEAQNARADGWTIWDGYSKENLEQQGEPENVNHRTQQEPSGSLSDKIRNIKLPEWVHGILGRNSNEEPVRTGPYMPYKVVDGKLEKLPEEPVRTGPYMPYKVVDGKLEKLPEEPPLLKGISEEDKKKALDKLKEAIRKEFGVKVNGKPIDDVIADLTGKNDGKLTAEQKEARAELNQKQSSIGMTYADAKAKVAEILQKYPNCYDIIEIPYNNKEHADKNGAYTLEYRQPEQRKVFNPDKLPEPARTEYKEAMASMTEIENANSALAQKGKVNVTPIKIEKDRHNFEIDLSRFEGIGFKPTAKPEPTETQKTARAKLNEKVSSTGISYKDAKATIASITNQYKNNPDYQSEFEQEQPKEIEIYYPPVKAFDPYKLKGADREVFFKALSAIHEIETANYALLTQAGLSPTKGPEMPQSKEKFFTEYN